MDNRIDAVYARQSVDKQDSISIESQIDFCKYELRGESCKEYTEACDIIEPTRKTLQLQGFRGWSFFRKSKYHTTGADSASLTCPT